MCRRKNTKLVPKEECIWGAVLFVSQKVSCNCQAVRKLLHSTLMSREKSGGKFMLSRRRCIERETI